MNQGLEIRIHMRGSMLKNSIVPMDPRLAKPFSINTTPLKLAERLRTELRKAVLTGQIIHLNTFEII